jgi:hypothetical protein
MERVAVDGFNIEHYRQRGYFEDSGITRAHFSVFLEVAAEMGVVILVRKGKRACLNWIMRGYPAKPLSINLAKTSARTGKVTCDPGNADVYHQVLQAQRAGCYVLEPDETNDRALRAVNPMHAEQPELAKEFPRGTPEMNEPGQVIEPDSGLAFTGDYDLMGVVDLKPRARAGGGSAAVRPPASTRFDLINPLATLVISKLNGRFGRRRIMHGPHDLKYRPDEHNRSGCSVFFPDGRVYYLPTVDDLKQFYDRGPYQHA